MIQGKCGAVKYALEFNTFTTGSSWNEPALKAVYHEGLSSAILSKMAYHDKQKSLNMFTDLAILFGHLLWRYLPPQSLEKLSSDPNQMESMQIGHTKLTGFKTERPQRVGLCLTVAAVHTKSPSNQFVQLNNSLQP